MMAVTGTAALVPGAKGSAAQSLPLVAPAQASAPIPPREVDPAGTVEGLTTDRPGGDFMVDVLKSLEGVTVGPASIQLVVLLSLTTVASIGAQAPAPAAPVQAAPAADAEEGRTLYNRHRCRRCHGDQAQGSRGLGPRLGPLPLAAFSRYVREPTDVMPPYTVGVLSDEDLAQIYAFVQASTSREVRMDYLFILGRILFGGFFVFSGVRHFQLLPIMAGFVGSKGFPAPKLAVIVSGLLIIFGGLSVLFGFRPAWGVAAITLFLVPVTLVMHNYWADTDPMGRINNQVNFMKNVALVGAAWMMLAIPQPWVMGLD